ncbi:MAG: PQQ-binding-like beta-propeller repeat protein [Haliscomenobacter sp.]|uniref:outer membrane protein assembly factor BamB family protein n=1 Tax=Haliscomenobacter sp. TaxID=2717303 RepID=UPI0029B91A99|nr:PQQ-binding-like beta-propeller repeat protein [Haliscomenobacter sp.]MDX2072375.1 PQQ-binding-like beta-propeller repeat protein [Haliscomenobacter sp.]
MLKDRNTTKKVFSLFTPVSTVLLLLVVIGLLSLTDQSDNNIDSSHSTWTHYGGSPDQSRYFAASEITKENVAKLQVAWMYPSGDQQPYFFSPIVVDTTMYVMGKNNSLIAVSALSGKEIWIHANLLGMSRRGLNYWESKDKKDKRLIFTLNNSLQAIDAVTGKTITSFGTDGYVDMREGLGRDPSSIRRMQAMMPGVIYNDLVIVGSAPGEGYFSAPGFVRAYNVVSGKLEWTFHTVPQPGEFGYKTWPKDAYKYVGGTNVWSEISVDQQRGIAFLPIGSPTYDFYGADRLGSNLFGNCLVAVDARTGKRLWHYQIVHHDLWDVDLASAPQLITVNQGGKNIDAVAVATKHGFLFVFDRETGKPLFPIEEKPFPASQMPGEKAWPTQPISSLPNFTRHEVTLETLNPFFPDSVKQQWQKRLATAKSGLYIPPSDKYETIMMPGALGGANYGNTASDPKNGFMYILTQEHASTYKLNKVAPPKVDLSADQVARVKTFYASTCQPCHGKNMEGVTGPALVNAGQYIIYTEFKDIVLGGKGSMPGFTHVSEETIEALYRYLGGNPRAFNFPRRANAAPPKGPVVASGGATIKPDAKRSAPMLDYPEKVKHPKDRYITDYGTEWSGLAAPPWSSIVAYDLNKGTIKWRKPVGLDSLYGKGDPSLGAPGGTLRKGMVVTSTGIVFATAKGGKLYAFDADNGNILWETNLSYEANAQPSMYTLNGKQYLVINATSNFTRDSYDRSKKPGALPRAYVVYALPNSK